MAEEEEAVRGAAARRRRGRRRGARARADGRRGRRRSADATRPRGADEGGHRGARRRGRCERRLGARHSLVGHGETCTFGGPCARRPRRAKRDASRTHLDRRIDAPPRAANTGTRTQTVERLGSLRRLVRTGAASARRGRVDAGAGAMVSASARARAPVRCPMACRARASARGGPARRAPGGGDRRSTLARPRRSSTRARGEFRGPPGLAPRSSRPPRRLVLVLVPDRTAARAEEPAVGRWTRASVPARVRRAIPRARPSATPRSPSDGRYAAPLSTRRRTPTATCGAPSARATPRRRLSQRQGPKEGERLAM